MNELKEWHGCSTEHIDFTHEHKTQCVKCASEGGIGVGDNTVNIVSSAVKNKLESVTGGVSSKESTDISTQDNNLSVDNTENSDIINKG